jgi:NTE family protein
MKIGLVLGAGGIVGHAYHSAVLAAISRVTGWDPDDADVIIGTSAGSGIAAVLRGGGEPGKLIARVLETPSNPEVIDRLERMTTPEPRSGLGALLPLPAAPMLALESLVPPWDIQLGPFLAGLLPEGRVHTEVMGEHPRDLHGPNWPDRPLWICATRLTDGELVVFGREGAPETDVGTAVQASCAIPTYFRQVNINGDRYVDGGVISPTNADLLIDRDLDLVVAVSPMSGTRGAMLTFPPLGRGFFARKLRRELEPIEEAGTPTLIIEPTLDEARVMGFNPMDPSKRVQVMLQSGASTLRFLANPAIADQVDILRRAAHEDAASSGPDEPEPDTDRPVEPAT